MAPVIQTQPTDTKIDGSFYAILAFILFLGPILFTISIVGIFKSKKLDCFVDGDQLMLLAVNMNFVAFFSLLG